MHWMSWSWNYLYFRDITGSHSQIPPPVVMLAMIRLAYYVTLCYMILLRLDSQEILFYPPPSAHFILGSSKIILRKIVWILDCSNGRILDVWHSSADYSQGAQAQRGIEWQRSAGELAAELKCHLQCSFYHWHYLFFGRWLAWDEFWDGSGKHAVFPLLATDSSFPVPSSSVFSP